MEILPVNEIKVDMSKIRAIENIMKSTFRLITYIRQHEADDLLTRTYLAQQT